MELTKLASLCGAELSSSCARAAPPLPPPIQSRAFWHEPTIMHTNSTAATESQREMLTEVTAAVCSGSQAE